MKYAAKKIGLMLLTMVIVSFLAFLAFQVIPGDPAVKLLGTEATPEKLAALMNANSVSCEELQTVVGKRGYFPEDMPIRDYPADFVEGCLVAAWPQVLQMVLDSRDLPF